MIKEFNDSVEEGEARMGRLKMIVMKVYFLKHRLCRFNGFKMIVMKEAKAVIEALEDAEAKRQEELGRRMNQLIEKLTGDLEVTFKISESFLVSII